MSTTTVVSNITTESPVAALAQPPSDFFLALLTGVVVFISLGMGCTLEKETVKKTVKKPIPPIIGLVCQYAFMPAVAYGLGYWAGFPPAKAVGLLLCGIAPGGSTSNLFSYYIGGDVSLSIFMTVCSGIFALGMMPFMLWAYGTSILENLEDPNASTETNSTSSDVAFVFDIPYGSLVLALLAVFIPTLLGIFIRSKSEKWAKRIEIAGSIIGALFILVAMVSAMIDNIELFNSDAQTWGSSFSLSVIGFTLAASTAALFHMDALTCLVIGLEVGIQDTIISITIAFLMFKDSGNELLNQALVFPLLCSFWDVMNSVIFLGVVQGVKLYKRRFATTITCTESNRELVGNMEGDTELESFDNEKSNAQI